MSFCIFLMLFICGCFQSDSFLLHAFNLFGILFINVLFNFHHTIPYGLHEKNLIIMCCLNNIGFQLKSVSYFIIYSLSHPYIQNLIYNIANHILITITLLMQSYFKCDDVVAYYYIFNNRLFIYKLYILITCAIYRYSQTHDKGYKINMIGNYLHGYQICTMHHIHFKKLKIYLQGQNSKSIKYWYFSSHGTCEKICITVNKW